MRKSMISLGCKFSSWEEPRSASDAELMADEQEQDDEEDGSDNPDDRLRQRELDADPPKTIADHREHDDVNDQLN